MFQKILPFVLVTSLAIVALGLYIFLIVIDPGGNVAGLPYWLYVVTFVVIIAEMIYLAIKAAQQSVRLTPRHAAKNQTGNQARRK